MNHVFKSVFNRRTGTWQVTSEKTRSAGKTGNSVSKPLLAMLLGLYAGAGMAQTSPIDGGGMETITAPWDVGAALIIGLTGTGTLNITAGAKVTDGFGYIGYNASSNGTAAVAGAGSAWENSDKLWVGYEGSGTLNITAGGKVTNTIASIGYVAGSNGTATVTGASSAWENSGSLSVGYAGTGTLNITAGGKVSNTTGVIGNNGGNGTATVSGLGSLWENTSELVVGNFGTGTLIVEDGGKVTNTDGYIGREAGSNGTATVTGPGSLWQNTRYMFVGNSGTLIVEDGGKVTNTTGYIGYNSNGTATVTGADSVWQNTGDLYVGRNGTGTLKIEDGGKVTNTTGYIGNNGNGTATITGAGSVWRNSSSLYVGGSGTGTGTGTLNIEDGGKVINAIGTIGYGSGSNGIATVTGPGSTWENTYSLYVGSGGTGTLNIEDGGLVTSNTVLLGAYGGSVGTLNLNGTSGARGILSTAYLAKGTGTATFNWNGGILQATGAQNNFLQSFVTSNITIGSEGAYFDTNGYNVGIATAGLLTGTGGLTKQGSGVLTIAGGNSYSGNTTVSQGTLKFGSYNQSVSQTLGIGVTSASNYGKLDVTGIATFNNNAKLNVEVASVPTLANGTILTDVIRADTLNANGFNVTDNSALFNFEAIQNANSVDLKVSANSSGGIRTAVTEGGQWSALGAASVLDAQVNNGATGDMGNVVTALGQLSNNRDVARATAQTLPVISGNQAVQGALSTFQNLVQNRNSNSAGATGLSGGDAFANKNAWGKVFGSRAEQDNRSGAAGFTADTWGLALGADAEVSPGARFGVAYGYAKTSVDGNTDLSGTAQRANIDSHVISAYGSKDIGSNRTFSFQGDIGLNNSKSTRDIEFGGLKRTARADYRTDSAHVGAAIAQAFEISEKTTLTPALRADYTWLKSQAYSESGADALNLNVGSNKTDAFVIGADAFLQHRFSNTSRFDANFGVGYDTINKQGNILAAYAGAPGQSFLTTGIDHSPWLVRGGIGYSMLASNGTEISFRYDAEGRSDFLNHTASVKAKWTF